MKRTRGWKFCGVKRTGDRDLACSAKTKRMIHQGHRKVMLEHGMDPEENQWTMNWSLRGPSS